MKCKIFAFPYAFGAAHVYQNLKEILCDDIDIVPIEYPGHGSRYGEALMNDIVGLAKDAYAQIHTYLEKEVEYALLGYSMGGLVAYELYKRIVRRGNKKPKVFFAFAASAPDVQYADRDYESYTLNDIKNKLIEMSGTPDEILNSDEMLEVFSPIIKNDLIALRNYGKKELPKIKIDCPLTVVRGHGENAEDSYKHWNYFSGNQISYHEIAGNHFFMFENSENLNKCAKIVTNNMGGHKNEVLSGRRRII